MLTTVEEATAIVLDNLRMPSVAEVSLKRSLGRVLAEDLCADRDFPPFDRVMMDGIAIHSASFNTEKRLFHIEAMQAAGDPGISLKDPDACIEIMTGAILPLGCDAVIRYEDIRVEKGFAEILIDTVEPGQNVHETGRDRKKGDLLVPAGRKISPAEIAVAATIGKHMIKVLDLPRIAILSTGNELIPVNEKPLAHQIRRSNVHMLDSMLDKLGIEADIYHLDDDQEVIDKALSPLLERYDVLMLSGGVSKGKFDFLPDALEKAGVRTLFHRVQQRPGKPFWFGASEKNHVFAFPGNPVSTFMCATRYFVPWWNASNGVSTKLVYAVLSEDFKFRPDLQYFLQVKLTPGEDGRFLAKPVVGHGSGDLANLCDADGFLELPASRSEFHAGEAFPYWEYRS